MYYFYNPNSSLLETNTNFLFLTISGVRRGESAMNKIKGQRKCMGCEEKNKHELSMCGCGGSVNGR
jgi:hypothetical protein